jgi:hypothetical protein
MNDTGKAEAVASKDLFAWEVEINSMACIVFAATKAKATWIAVKGYWAAGYGRGSGTWPRGVMAKRYPAFDRSTLKSQPPRAWVPDYVRSCA